MPRSNPLSPSTALAPSDACARARSPLARLAAAGLLALAVAAVPLAPGRAAAQDAAPAAASAPAGDANLGGLVDDFWHYAKIARYDAANVKAKQILDANPDPNALLTAFESTVSKRPGDDLSAGMVRFRATPELSENAEAIQKVLIQGRYARRTDAKFIESNIQRLITNQIGYENGLTNLRNSGEVAVPLMLDYLRSPEKAQYHDAVRRAIKDLGREALNPLVAATEMQDADTLSLVITLLGELGYDDAVPYVQRVQANAQTSALKEAAGQTLSRLGGRGNADESFLALAEKFFAGRSAIAPDNRNPNAFVWYWNEAAGLTRKEVPPATFGQIMAMRACEYSLNLSQGMTPTADSAMSLWLAANYKRQVTFAGAEDPTRQPNQPDAHYYGVTSGPKYLGTALKRELDLNDAAVAYEMLRSEQDIIGRSTLNVTGEGQSLVQALSSPDRRVRYEAAFALAAAKPQEGFQGSDSVVPLLGEAVSQTGKATALVIAGNTDRANAAAEPLKAAGYEVSTATDASDAAKQASNQPAIDIVLFEGDLPKDQIDAVLSQLATAPKLRGSARLALVKTTQSPFEERKLSDPLLSTTTAAGGDELKQAVDAARAKAGALPVDAAVATDYALRAAAMLDQVTGSPVYNIAAAKRPILAGLSDARPEVVTAVAKVAAGFDDADAQQALLARANATDLDGGLRITLYKALASNAKQFGNKLGDAVGTLEGVVTGEQKLDVRNAAAEARGALNLPSEQAKSIILKQAQH